MITDEKYSVEFSNRCCSETAMATIDPGGNKIFYQGLGVRIEFNMETKSVDIKDIMSNTSIPDIKDPYIWMESVYKKHLSTLKGADISEDWSLFIYWFPMTRRFMEVRYNFAVPKATYRV